MNNIGRIISKLRTKGDTATYNVSIVMADTNTVVDHIQAVAVGATYENGDFVHLNRVQDRWYIIADPRVIETDPVVDFIVDNFDRPDWDDLGVNWSSNYVFSIRDGRAVDTHTNAYYEYSLSRQIHIETYVSTRSRTEQAYVRYDANGDEIGEGESHEPGTSSATSQAATVPNTISGSGSDASTGTQAAAIITHSAASNTSYKAQTLHMSVPRTNGLVSRYLGVLSSSDVHVKADVYVVSLTTAYASDTGDTTTDNSTVYDVDIASRRVSNSTLNIQAASFQILSRVAINEDAIVLEGVSYAVKTVPSTQYAALNASIGSTYSDLSSISMGRDGHIGSPHTLSAWSASTTASTSGNLVVSGAIPAVSKGDITRWQATTIGGVILSEDAHGYDFLDGTPIVDTNHGADLTRIHIYNTDTDRRYITFTDTGAVIEYTDYTARAIIIQTPDVEYYSVSDATNTLHDDITPLTPGNNTIELIVSGTVVTLKINGNTVHSGSQISVLSGDYVGMAGVGNLLQSQIDTFGRLSDFIGITRFKAWVGNVEPPDSESGHGTINAGVVKYTDSYHTIDANGDVIYNPLANE